MFNCFCSNKKYMKENVIPLDKSHDKFIKSENSLKILNQLTNEIVSQKDFTENIITTNTCLLNQKHYIACTQNVLYILDKELNELKKIDFEDDILCSCSEPNRKRNITYFYLGFRSGRIAVFSIKYLNDKFVHNELWNFYCFKPVYSIAIHFENMNETVKRKVYAGFSRWGDMAMEAINI